MNLAVLLDAPTKWHPLQVTFQAVVPLVVGTDKFLLVAMALAAELHATVSADVFDHMNCAISVARHDDRAFPDLGSLEIPVLGNLSFQSDIAPVAGVEKALKLALVQGFIRVGGERDAARGRMPCGCADNRRP